MVGSVADIDVAAGGGRGMGDDIGKIPNSTPVGGSAICRCCGVTRDGLVNQERTADGGRDVGEVNGHVRIGQPGVFDSLTTGVVNDVDGRGILYRLEHQLRGIVAIAVTVGVVGEVTVVVGHTDLSSVVAPIVHVKFHADVGIVACRAEVEVAVDKPFVVNSEGGITIFVFEHHERQYRIVSTFITLLNHAIIPVIAVLTGEGLLVISIPVPTIINRYVVRVVASELEHELLVILLCRLCIEVITAGVLVVIDIGGAVR